MFSERFQRTLPEMIRAESVLLHSISIAHLNHYATTRLNITIIINRNGHESNHYEIIIGDYQSKTINQAFINQINSIYCSLH